MPPDDGEASLRDETATDADVDADLRRTEWYDRLWWVPLICWPIFFGSAVVRDDPSPFWHWLNIVLFGAWIVVAAISVARRLWASKS